GQPEAQTRPRPYARQQDGLPSGGGGLRRLSRPGERWAKDTGGPTAIIGAWHAAGLTASVLPGRVCYVRTRCATPSERVTSVGWAPRRSSMRLQISSNWTAWLARSSTRWFTRVLWGGAVAPPRPIVVDRTITAAAFLPSPVGGWLGG